jgi:uncharacterized protein YhaN
MRIVDINVDGFGQFHGAHLAPAPGLTVIRGPNEAGKTTLLAFIRAMLFGFESGRYPAFNGGRRGGWLSVEMADGRPFRIERYGEKGGGGKLSVQDAQHKELGEGALATLLQGVEKGVYRNIFAFGLEELTAFRSLTDAEVAARMYGASLGTGVSGPDVENDLRGEMEELFKPGGQLPRINALLRELEELDAQLKDRDLPAEYAGAGERLGEVERRLGEVNTAYASTSAQRRVRQRVVEGWPTWLELRAAREERTLLGEVAAFPLDTLERLSHLETALSGAEETARDAAVARDHATLEVDAATLDEAALAHRQELEDLAAAAGAETARRDERTRTDRELAQARTTVDTAVAKLGPGWGIERVEAFDDSVSVHSEMAGHLRTMLDQAGEAKASARRELKATEDRLAEVTTQLEGVTARMEELAAELGGRLPFPARERALQQISGLTERIDEQRRIAADAPEADLGAQRTSLERRTHDARELAAAVQTRGTTTGLLSSATATAEATSARPWEPYLLPAIVAVAGLIVALALLLADAGPTAVILVAVGAVALAGALAYLRRPTAVSEVERVRDRLLEQLDQADAAIARLGPDLDLGREPAPAEVDRLLATLDDARRVLEADEARRDRAITASQELERLSAQLAAVAEGVGLPAEPDPGELEAFSGAIETDRTSSGRMTGLQEQAAGLRATLATVTTRRDELVKTVRERNAEADTALATWHDWLREHDLDPSYDPETAARVVDAVTAAKATVTTLRTLEARQAAQQAERETFLAKVSDLADLLPAGITVDADPDGSAVLLGRRLATALDGEHAMDALVRAQTEREEALRLAEEARTAAKASLDAFLQEAGVTDPADLRAEVDRSIRANVMEGQAASLTTALATLSGPGEALSSFQADLHAVTDIVAVEGEVEELDRRLADLDAERDALNQEAGALRKSREEMEADAAATGLRQLRADTQARIEAAAERWTVLALARHFLVRSRHVYEEAHRPAVVTAAERHFSRWTGGRYPRIIAPLGKPIEGAVSANGEPVGIPALSRGTSEQLYLALRLGLVEHLVETSGEPLPIVMDDILVNFDDDRAARAARSIEELAQTCQIIYFTCHPSTPLKADKEETLRVSEVA